MEIASQRRESGNVSPDTGPEGKSPLDVDVPLTVTDNEDLLCRRHGSEPLDVVGDILGSVLCIAKRSSR